MTTLFSRHLTQAREIAELRAAIVELTKRLEGWGDQESSAYARIGAPSPRSLRRWGRTGGERDDDVRQARHPM